MYSLLSLSLFPTHSQDGEITIGTRDGAAHVLRCLKVWYDLPNDVLFNATNLVDRFLTKMKVKPKHMACISVGAFHLAVKQLGLLPIDTEDLVAISQVSYRPTKSLVFLSMSSIILHGMLVQVEVGNIKCRYPKKNCIFLLNDSQERPCVRAAALRGNYCFLVFAGWRQLTSREFGKSFECSRWALCFVAKVKKDACLCCVTPAIFNLLFDIWVDNRQWEFIQREKFTLPLP